MKTWDWWVPWVFSVATFIATHLLTRRSQSFQELTEVKNAYKMRVEELEKKVVTQEKELESLGKVVKETRTQQEENMKFMNKLQRQTNELIERESECQKRLQKFIDQHHNGRFPS